MQNSVTQKDQLPISSGPEHVLSPVMQTISLFCPLVKVLPKAGKGRLRADCPDDPV